MNNQQIYGAGIEILRQHSDRVCQLVMKSRKENKGNFKYIEKPDMKREQEIAKLLKFMMWRLKLRMEGRSKSEKGCCDILCYDCECKWYLFHSKSAPDHWNNNEKEGWRCQYECECK